MLLKEGNRLQQPAPLGDHFQLDHRTELRLHLGQVYSVKWFRNREAEKGSDRLAVPFCDMPIAVIAGPIGQVSDAFAPDLQP